MKISYQAEDGTRFDTEAQCLAYEATQAQESGKLYQARVSPDGLCTGCGLYPSCGDRREAVLGYCCTRDRADHKAIIFEEVGDEQ